MVKVPQEIYDGLEQIRSSCEINMFDRSGVQAIANREEMYALVTWIEDHKDEYVDGIFSGFEAE